MAQPDTDHQEIDVRSFPRRRSWLIPAVIAAAAFVGGVASNLVASDIQDAVKPYRRWVWVTFAVALVMAIIAAIRVERSSNDIEASSMGANAQRAVAAGDVTNAAIVTGDENMGLQYSQVQGPVQMVGRQVIHHHYHSGPETVSSLHQLPSQPSSQKAEGSRDAATGVAFNPAHALLNEPMNWSAKTVRLGLKYGLLEQNQIRLTLSGKYITRLCEEARRLATSELKAFLKEGWIALQVAAAGTAKTLPAYKADFIDMVTEIGGIPVASYLMKVGYDAKVLKADDDGFKPDDELINELLEILVRTYEYGDLKPSHDIRPLVIESLVGVINARLVINCSQLQNHCHILALLLYSLYGLENFVTSALSEIMRSTEWSAKSRSGRAKKKP